MIAIFSKSDTEESTNDVIDWIRYFGGDYVRLNGKEFHQNFDWNLSEIDSFSTLETVFKEVNVCWYRRWYSDEDIMNSISQNSLVSKVDIIKIFGHLQNERNTINNFLWYFLIERNWLSNPLISHRKLHVLNEAMKVNLKTPNTIITNKKDTLQKFVDKHKKVITKTISDSPTFIDSESFNSLYTVPVNNNFISEIPDTFIPTLFQEQVEKKYELRVFVLKNKIWSMAIFSQADSTTSVDFRNYNITKPNRTIPYVLPEEIEKKILKLFQNLNLLTGSVDILRGINGDYIFLEINDRGQFGMTSYPCNFFLESEIASYLISNDYVKK